MFQKSIFDTEMWSPWWKISPPTLGLCDHPLWMWSMCMPLLCAWNVGYTPGCSVHKKYLWIYLVQLADRAFVKTSGFLHDSTVSLVFWQSDLNQKSKLKKPQPIHFIGKSWYFCDLEVFKLSLATQCLANDFFALRWQIKLINCLNCYQAHPSLAGVWVLRKIFFN